MYFISQLRLQKEVFVSTHKSGFPQMIDRQEEAMHERDTQVQK